MFECTKRDKKENCKLAVRVEYRCGGAPNYKPIVFAPLQLKIQTVQFIIQFIKLSLLMKLSKKY